MGSKTRIAKYIVPIIQEYIDKNNITIYIEPFVGGANVIDKINCDIRIGNDNNKYLIQLYQNLDKLEELPDFIEKEDYIKVKEKYNNNQTPPPEWYIGAIGFLASYNGKFYDGGYAGKANTKIGTVRNYYDEGKRNLLKQRDKIKDVVWENKDFEELEISNGALVYCDIPYFGTTQYNTSRDFDYDRFWDWARKISRTNILLVSECTAPDDFYCIWEQEVSRTVDNKSRKQVMEKLFMCNDITTNNLS